MRMHVVQHVPFEGPGAIAQWAAERGYELTSALALLEEYPPAEQVDFLVVMGGPMDADDEVTSPWLTAEKHFVAAVIAAGRPVLGVCLGAQILAEVLGGVVRRMEYPEIGWYPVLQTPEGAEDALFSAWNEPSIVGQWHGDTFELPLGMEPTLSSQACRNQAFVFDGRVVGLQFHIEWTEKALAELVAQCADDLAVDSPFVMTAEQIAEGAHLGLPAGREKLFALLDDMASIGSGEPGGGPEGFLPHIG